MGIKHFFIVLALSTLVTTSKVVIDESVALKSHITTVKAGEPVALEFSGLNKNTMLFCSNSYGATVLKHEFNTFTLPEFLVKKSGILNWKLTQNDSVLSGQIAIKPLSNISTLESYLGPPSIIAGKTDFTMLVVIPTDGYDNPLADDTTVTVNHQFSNAFETSDVKIKHGFSYKNISSKTRTGRILINSKCKDLNSKEFDVNVMPAIPANFTISSERIHEYADGNQITTLKTSVIKDIYNNIIADGTYVVFHITNKKGYLSKAYGAAINGVATAKMLHPQKEESWSVKAYIDGMANSNTISLNYKQAILDFDIVFSEDNREIKVGPLQSFMKQRIPDGLEVELKITNSTSQLLSVVRESRNGFVTFYLNKAVCPKGDYNIDIETAGIVKSFKTIAYE